VKDPVLKPVADNIVIWGEYFDHREGQQEAGGKGIIQNLVVCAAHRTLLRGSYQGRMRRTERVTRMGRRRHA